MADALDIPQSERHDFRIGSLITGLLVVCIAALFLLDDSGLVDVDATVAAAVLVVVYSGITVIRLLVRSARPRGSG